MVYTQPNTCPRKKTRINSYGTLTYKSSPNPEQKTRSDNNQPKKKKENLQNCRLCYPGKPQKKSGRMLKEGWVRCLRIENLWNMKVTIVLIVIGAFGTITKGILKGLEDLKFGGRVETIQMTALLRTARILRRVMETWGDWLSLKLQWKTIS